MLYINYLCSTFSFCGRKKMYTQVLNLYIFTLNKPTAVIVLHKEWCNSKQFCHRLTNPFSKTSTGLQGVATRPFSVSFHNKKEFFEHEESYNRVSESECCFVPLPCTVSHRWVIHSVWFLLVMPWWPRYVNRVAFPLHITWQFSKARHGNRIVKTTTFLADYQNVSAETNLLLRLKNVLPRLLDRCYVSMLRMT